MQTLEFTKMAGCGNDFIIIDNRSGQIESQLKRELAQTLCRRKRSLGADGLIFVEKSSLADAKMEFFNSDGSKGEMCGNGLRCFARYLAEAGICKRMMQLETDAGLYMAKVIPENLVRLVMPPVKLPKRNLTLPGLPELDFVTVGVPHAIIFAQGSWDWEDARLIETGRLIRQHPYFPLGTNVNFVTQDENILKVRTYERGVEGETLACGTGATASALASSLIFPQLTSPITVHTRGGTLQVGFQRSRDGFIDVWLQGNALILAKGIICPDAFSDIGDAYTCPKSPG